MLRQRVGHDLGEGWEDGVLELGEDEPDQTRAVTAKVSRPLVAENIERCQHRRACRL